MKNKGLIYTLLIIIIAGFAITMGTSSFIGRSREQMSQAPAVASAVAGVEIALAGLDSEMGSQGTDRQDAGGGNSDMIQEAEPAERKARDTAVPGDEEMSADEDQAVGAEILEGGVFEEEAEIERGLEFGPSVTADGPVANEIGPDAQEAAPVKQRMEKAQNLPVDIEMETVMSPMEPVVSVADEEGKDRSKARSMSGDSEMEQSVFLDRLREVDVQIEMSRDKQSLSNNYSAKKSADNELKLWDAELNAIYGAIMERLEVAEASTLVDEQRQWMKERDRMAAEAVKASAGGSMESVEYIGSLAATTRTRAYELVEIYGDLLRE